MATKLTKGVYKAEVVDYGIDKAKTGNPQIIIKVKVLAKVNIVDKSTKDIEPTTRTIYLTLTANSKQYVDPKLKACGWGGEAYATLDKDSPHHQSLVGNPVEVRLDKDETEEKYKWDVSTFTEAKPLKTDSSVAKGLDAVFGNFVKPKPRTQTKPAEKPPEQKAETQEGTTAESSVSAPADAGEETTAAPDDLPF